MEGLDRFIKAQEFDYEKFFNGKKDEFTVKALKG